MRLQHALTKRNYLAAIHLFYCKYPKQLTTHS